MKNSALDRFYELCNGAKKTISENKKIGNIVSTAELIKEANDGKSYAIFKEGTKFYIKEANTKENLTVNDFNFIGGEVNARHYVYETYNKALAQLNGIVFEANESNPIIKENCETKTEEKKDDKKETVEEGYGSDYEIEDVNEEKEETKESFSYDGEKFKVNPFAVCNKTVGSKKDNPEKWERCVQGVKDNSKIGESVENIMGSKLYEDVVGKMAERLLTEGFGNLNEKIVLNVPKDEPTEPENKPVNSNDNETKDETPFGKEKFDPGVEVSEEEDPKKFIEQLTGKLAQSLRSYNKESVDFDLEKYVINSVLSAIHTGDMDTEDQNDIIKKIKEKGSSEENTEPAKEETKTDATPAEPEAKPNTETKTESKEEVEDDMVFEIMDMDDECNECSK